MQYNRYLDYRSSTRLPRHDYTAPGSYLITVCTFERETSLGEISKDEISLSEIGTAARECWLEIPDHFEYVELDVFQIMPDHIHGILRVNRFVGTRHAVSQPPHEQFGKPVSGSIPTVIRSFKSAATKAVNEMRGTPGNSVWQPGFYEHIIRSDAELYRLRSYIRHNVRIWDEKPNIAKGWKLHRCASLPLHRQPRSFEAGEVETKATP